MSDIFREVRIIDMDGRKGRVVGRLGREKDALPCLDHDWLFDVTAADLGAFGIQHDAKGVALGVHRTNIANHLAVHLVTTVREVHATDGDASFRKLREILY